MNEPMKIYDGGTEKTAKNWNGYHPLFTAAARRGVLFGSVKIWMLLGFVVGTGAGIALDVGPASVLIGLSMVVVVWFGMRDDVYKKIYGPDHDRGRLDLPEGMSWDEAVERIRRGFANPDVEQVTDTPDAITFYSKKRGTYQLQNTADGLKMTILTKPSKSSKKEYLYAVFSSVLLSQVIALLYPQMISATQVEEEKAAVQKLFKAYKMPFLLELVLAAVLLVFMGITLYKVLYSDSARSKGVSDSYLEAFPSGVTVGEVLDDFFADGKWDNYEQNGVTYASYTGTGENTQTGEKIVICFYFKINSDKTAKIDRITWNGDTMNTLEQFGVISALNDSYRESHGLASSNALDSAFDELENALDEALAEPASSEAEPESESFSEDTEEADAVSQSAGLEDEQLTGTNGTDTYSKLAGEISANHNDYDGMTESEKNYYLSYGNQFRTAWLNAMYTDVEEDSGRYGNAVALETFFDYMDFYSTVTSYSETGSETGGMMRDFYDVMYGMEDQIYLDEATDSEAAPYVENVLQLAEAYGAEWQGW